MISDKQINPAKDRSLAVQLAAVENTEMCLSPSVSLLMNCNYTYH